MNSKPLIAFLAAVSLSGCVIYETPRTPPPVPGDVTFTWSFAGKSCPDVPQIKSVVVTIPGQTLLNNGVFPCLANNYPGIVLHDLPPGSYSFTLEALGYGNEVLFTGSGSITVNGDVRATVDLSPVGGPSSYAYLKWHFPASSAATSPSCDQVGVVSVDVSIDGAAPTRLQCSDGFVEPGTQTPYLAPGTHTIDLVALDASNYPRFRFTGSLQTQAGSPVSSDYLLSWAVGGASVRWQFTDGAVALTCADAGVATVMVNFQDADGNLVYGTTYDPQACGAAPVSYNYLKPGSYKIFMTAVGTGGAQYRSNWTTPPAIAVVAGQFPSLAGALPVQLFRQ